jgi:hypothetical protein
MGKLPASQQHSNTPATRLCMPYNAAPLQQDSVLCSVNSVC